MYMKKYLISGLLAMSIFSGALLVQANVAPVSCVAVSGNLTVGSRGAQVTTLQNFLSDGGFYSSNARGYFGSITKKAVKAFQKSSGVPATGFVGAMTRQKISANCSQGDPISTSSLNITSPKPGEKWGRGSVQKIQWTDKNVYIVTAKYDIFIAPKSPCPVGRPCTLMMIKPYTIATSTTLSTDGYLWNVGLLADVDRTLPDGAYYIKVCPTGGSDCAQSGNITISTAANSIAPKVLQLAPSSGVVGQQVTLTGNNFTGSNIINFGYGVIPNVASTNNGTVITFTVPSQLNPACYYATPVHCMVVTMVTPPNVYKISVTNENGSSNYLPFVVREGNY
jgi:hypothetical protein